MSLKSILKVDNLYNKKGISDERAHAAIPEARKMIAFWRAYPDLFIDFMKGPNSTFKLYPFQRITLRIFARYRETFATFCRGYSKSFIAVLCLMIKCILYPNSKLFMSAEGKEQSVSILTQKVQEICNLIPGFYKEINWGRGQSRMGRDDITIKFKNGSELSVLQASERSRGQRRVGGLFEEAATMDGDILNEVLIPTMSISRLLPDGTRQPQEVINKNCTYITSAKSATSFAYDKLMEILIKQVTQKKQNAFAFGGSWRIPIQAGLYDPDYIKQMKESGTYTEETFLTEFESRWEREAEGAFFSVAAFDRSRVLKDFEVGYNKAAMAKNKLAYYLLAIDVGRIGCTTEVCVFRVMPQPGALSRKSLVNIFTYEAEDFEKQAIKIKKLFIDFKAKVAVVDANGLGIGLCDFLTKPQTDPDTGEELQPWGPINNENSDGTKIYKDLPANTIHNAFYMMKANAEINTQAATYVKVAMGSNNFKMLIDEQQAKINLLNTKIGQDMTPEQRIEWLQPYSLTTALRGQMMNLIEKSEGANILLKQESKKILKDKYSALSYGIYYIQKQDEKSRKRGGSWAQFMFHN